jgi:PAS domain S-box-containing protein
MTSKRIEAFAGYRNRLLDEALLWSTVAAVPGVALSLARAASVGWKPVMGLHLVILGVLCAVWLGRARLAYSIRVGTLLTMIAGTLFAGLAQFGPAAGGQSFAIVFAFTSMLFLSVRTALILVVANAVVMIVLGYAATRYWLPFAFDYQAYAHHPTTWVSLTWTLTSYGTIMAYIVWRMVEELQARRQVAERLLEENRSQVDEVRLTRQRLSATLENAPYVAVQWYDRDGRVRYWNHASELIYGWTAAEVAGRTFGELLAGKHEAGDFAAALACLDDSGRATGPREFAVRHRDGSPRIVSSTLFTIPDGEESLFVCMSVDVTARHQLEKDMRESESRFRNLFESSPDPVWIIDNYRFVECNQAAVNKLGYADREAVLHLHPAQISPERQPDGEASLEKAERMMDNALERGGNRFEWLHTRADGGTFFAEVTLSAFELQGRRCLYCVWRDITGRKQAAAQLAASEVRFRQLFAVAPVPLCYVGRDGRLIEINERFTRTFGYTLDDVPNLDAWWLRAHPDADYRRRVLQTWKAALARAARQGRDIEPMEYEVASKDGRVRTMLISGITVGDDFLATFFDLTERKEAERAILASKEAAEAASRAKSNFLSSMSHELRTPLNSIIGFAQMLDMGVPGPLAPTQKEAVGHILGGGRHLLGLINEILDLARIEAGKLDLAIETVPLKPLMAEIVAYSISAAAPRRIEIGANCQFCSACLAVRADRSRMKQVLLNLLNNAVKYNREDGLVTITCRQVNEAVRIAVTDTGPGIEPAQQARLFEPFQRLGAENSAVEGTGIGLVISKKFTEAMGGRIGFESEVGVGSRFWLDLPVADSDPVHGPAPETAATQPAEPVDDLARGRVLYIEDNPANVTLMKALFRQLPGVELGVAGSAEAGLEVARLDLPDLVLLDINLPGISGLEALRRLQADPLTAAIPAIAVSASAMPRDVEAGLAAGFHAYFTKPFDVAAVLAVIRAILSPDGRLPGAASEPPAISPER